MPCISRYLSQVSVLLILALLTTLAGCSPKPPVKPDPNAPQATIGR
jgi:hypothetical protein